ncbi:class I adenylate-forming enzyme family protein [Paraburkholderia sp. BL9I2N2]|uniref:AMP-binding protein n=1 Tax=Paraburkholderia sp. BL9I2N2 TaxID=1938809 RepID=UPI0010EF2A1D|nr:class I adenylate-forming enzyme family protein [Paraburkholderia sp. BL9I2N2]TCK84132.1 AMP-binding enzyme [Paraburkholderia sp. BL9I2N2]
MTNAAHIDIAPVSDETIAALLTRRAQEAPDAVYCYFKESVISIGELNRRVDQLAGLLRDRGLRRGDRVALMLPSHPDHIVAIFALAKLALVRVPVNIHLKGASLAHLFDHLAPNALIADSEYAEPLRPELAKVQRVLWSKPTFDGLAEAPGSEFADDG